MSKNLYVGNLSFKTTSDDLRRAFESHGTVVSASVVTDRETGRSRGFGFVEMSDGGDRAVESMNNFELDGRRLTVNEARPRAERSGGGGGGGHGGGGGGGRGGYNRGRN
ncbi:MAG: RNA-binding protein [Pirellulaceae bacterium]|jgi:RNA recognition motif-containing protein